MKIWSIAEEELLIRYYPLRGKIWCAKQLNRSEASIRQKTSNMKLKQNRDSIFFTNWQTRAANSKIGKKRPDQALVMKKNHDEGKLIKNEEQKKACSIRMKEYIKIHGHPKGMLGKKHTNEVKKIFSKNSKKMWDNMSKKDKEKIKKKMIHTRFINGKYSSHRITCTWKAAWREFGGKKYYYRSKWEANYGRYLEWLKQNKQIKDWLHEPEVFWFDGVKRGCVSYLPDFKVITNNDSFEYHEVKGWMDNRSKTKIKRMAKYFPKIKLIVIREKQYKEIKLKLSSMIKDWEM